MSGNSNPISAKARADFGFRNAGSQRVQLGLRHPPRPAAVRDRHLLYGLSLRLHLHDASTGIALTTTA
ncbi:hypothetical protein OHA25_38705 [Nonomuraea sp. NBC_00507]|uniref:hypothetical protein n=1 Tax=Nonomuraea sp. NBC_00507 TaxID=2976002 RepID=UPI002E193F6A